MSSKATKKALYAKLVPRWPADPLRPQAQFQALLSSRLEKDFGDATVVQTSASEASFGPDGKPLIRKIGRKADTDSQWKALTGLMDNRYQKKYLVTEKLTQPASNPTYYEKLIAEMDEVPKRSWLGNYLNSWRGYIRWE